MPLRLMQIFVPHGHPGRPEELLEGRDIVGRWRDTDADTTVLHLIVPAEETEPIMDRFERQYSSVTGFHVILFPVEAVLPRPPAKEEEPPPPPSAAPAEPPQPTSLRISREELYANVSEGSEFSRVFVGMTILSAIVAAVGLIRNDVAVIIGAMVIAPLLGPNVAISLATTLGDTSLLRRALMTNLAGVITAFGFAVAVGMVFSITPDVPAIASRTQLGLGDILLALAAGTAGTLAYTRGLSGAVIGVMVAVALVPPLVVCGMLLGKGHFAMSFGAFLLTAANVTCVNLAGVVTFLVQGVRPRTWWETEKARQATRRAILIWAFLLLLLIAILWLELLER